MSLKKKEMRFGRAGIAHSRIGMALFVLLFVAILVSIGVAYVTKLLRNAGNDFVYTSWYVWVSDFLPTYLIAYPIGLLIMKREPKCVPQKTKLRIGDLLAYFAMCIPLMYLGSMIGNALSGFLSGGTAENPLGELVADDGILKFLIMVVAAPILEELIFRKAIIDRSRRYGERSAIFFSAIMFGLFHGNLFQFFYAFILGLLFAYVYMRTGHVRYTIFMHMAINFLGSILAPYMAGLAENVLEGEASVRTILAVSLYGYGLIALIVTGIVLLALRANRFHLEPAEEEIPAGRRLLTVYCNVGVILFAALCAVSIVLSLIDLKI